MSRSRPSLVEDATRRVSTSSGVYSSQRTPSRPGRIPTPVPKVAWAGWPPNTSSWLLDRLDRCRGRSCWLGPMKDRPGWQQTRPTRCLHDSTYSSPQPLPPSSISSRSSAAVTEASSLREITMLHALFVSICLGTTRLSHPMYDQVHAQHSSSGPVPCISLTTSSVWELFFPREQPRRGFPRGGVAISCVKRATAMPRV